MQNDALVNDQVGLCYNQTCTSFSLERLANQYNVIAGTSRVSRFLPTPSGVTVRVKRKVLHPEIGSFDLALLELEQPLTFGPTIHPVCLSPQDDIPSGPCFATGWGELRTSGKYRIKKYKL